MKRYFLLWILLLALLGVRGQDGSLDSAFNGIGWTKMHFTKSVNLSSERTDAMAVQPDGDYVVLLRSKPFSIGPSIAQFDGFESFLARYHADGTLDSTFGTRGFSKPITLDAHAVAVQPLTGGGFGLVVAGYVSGEFENSIVTLERYTSEGILDASFGTAGRVQVDFSPYSPYSGQIGLAVHDDGSIVVLSSGAIYPPEGVGAAALVTETHYALLVARLTENGAPDGSLGTGGKVLVEFGTTDVMANAVTLEADRDIVVAGRTATNAVSYYSFFVARIKGDGDSIGKLDAGFGSDGIAITSFEENAYVTALAIQSNGTIVAAGTAVDITSYTDNFALALYDSYGILTDTVTTHMGANEQISSIALDSEDRIVVGGRYYWYEEAGATFNLALARYTAAGVLDNTFNPNGDIQGTIVTSIGSGEEGLRSVAVLSGGGIIAGGWAENSSNFTQNADLFLARYTSDGVLDTEFNFTGIAFGYYAWDAEAKIAAVAVQAGGKVVVAGESLAYNPSGGTYRVMAVARYNANGTLDTDFGTGGSTLVDFGFEVSVTSMVIQYDQKIVVGGGTSYYDSQPHYDFALARFTSNGHLDATFDGDGIVTTDFDSRFDFITALAMQGDGKIVAVGESEKFVETEFPDFVVVRYNSDGSLDSLFGKATADFYGYRDIAVGVAVQKDGKIVVAGSANNADPLNPWDEKYDFAVARFTSGGQLDRTFSGDGKATADLGYIEYATALALQPDGKIVVGGMVVAGGGEPNAQSMMADFAVARFTSGGQLDRTFSGDGKATVDIAGWPDQGGWATLQPDGKIVLSGWYTQETLYGGDTTYLALARLTAAGEPDNTFDGDGKATYHLGQRFWQYAAAWYGGRLYVGGELNPRGGLQSGVLAAIKANTATPVPTLPVVSINDQEVEKTQSEARLTITVTGEITTPFTVNYATQDVSAVSKGKTPDYGATKGAVTFSKDYVGPYEVVIPIYYKSTNAGYPKEFKVNLTFDRRTPNAATFSKSTGVVTIILPVPAVAQAAQVPPETAGGKLAATAFPNPTTGYFTLQLQGGSDTPVTVRVTDNTGRVLETKAVAARSTLQLGSTYRPGIYYLYLQQGSESQVLKLVKQAP